MQKVTFVMLVHTLLKDCPVDKYADEPANSLTAYFRIFVFSRTLSDRHERSREYVTCYGRHMTSSNLFQCHPILSERHLDNVIYCPT